MLSEKVTVFEEGQVLLFNKPVYWTSFDLVNKVRIMIRSAFGIKKIKVRHAGTLDPLASGLLIICTGRATKKIDEFRDLDKEKDTQRHMKYLRNENLSWEAAVGKAKLPQRKCKGIYTAPLAIFDESGLDPDIVFFMLVPYQAYHVLNDYMAATGRSSLQFNHTPNSAVCSGSVWAYNHNTANLTTMCAGSKTSGKTDMTMMNLFIPGKQMKPTAAQLIKRVAETGGPSVLGKGGEPWPGLDVCKGCPLFKYEAV